MDWRRLLPEMMRDTPPSFEMTYIIAPPLPVPAGGDERAAAALRAAGVVFSRQGAGVWGVQLPWRTLVFGLIAREVDEELVLALESGEEAGVRLRCRPRRTHEAHAVGLAAVLLIAVTVWLVSGWAVGLPAGLTCLAGGAFWVAYTRELALQGLERRLRRLVADLGTALWPGVPGRVVPPPGPGLGRMDL